MICRIRYVKIRPEYLEDYKKLASDWKTLINKYGGSVLGFYYDKNKDEVIGIAEYDSLEKLNELQRNCRADVTFPAIREQVKKTIISGTERILVKLEI